MTPNPVAVNYQCWAARRASAHIAADGTVDFDREAEVAARVESSAEKAREAGTIPAAPRRRIGSEGGGRLPHPGWVWPRIARAPRPAIAAACSPRVVGGVA